MDSSSDYAGHYGQAFQPQPTHRGGPGFYGGRGPHRHYPQKQGNHYMGGYPGDNQMVPYGNYGPNPFTPMTNNSNGASYFGGEPRQIYDMMPYQPSFYGVPPYNLPAPLQQFHISPAPPPSTEPPAQPATPKPKEPPIDIEKIKLEAQIAAMKAQEEKQKALDEQRERDTHIRRETEEAMNKRMEEMRRQQEEAQKEISRARAEAEAAAVARVEAERRAAEERARQEAEAMQRAEENARKRLEAEIKAAEERSQREQEERIRIEEAERYRLMQDGLRRKTEADVLAKVEAEKEAARKAAEAEAAASQEHEALKKRIQEEAKAKFEEAAKTAEEVAKTAEQLPIKFKDAVGRKFSFPFRLCSTWQGMEELIKQAFLHIDVIGPHGAIGPL